MYSFEPSDEQKLLQEATRKFASRELREASRGADDAGELPAGLLDAGWELGILPASIPEEFGGFGEHSAVTGVLAAEELARGDLSGALALLAPNLTAFAVLYSGTREQKERLLPRYCGEVFPPSSAALMEPRYDFAPDGLQTTATRDAAGGFSLSGLKCNVPFAAEAEQLLVYAALDGRTEAFLVPRGAAGLEVRRREENMGLRALPLYSVRLEGCAIPVEARLGGEQGCEFPRLLAAARVALAAMAVGVAVAAHDYALQYAKSRKAFGEAIAQRQSIAFMLAEMATELEGARMMVWEAAWLLDRGADAGRAAYLAKNFADDMVLMVADRAVQILGGHGYIRDYPVELWLRNARGFAVLDGLAMV
jgi:alkylation response protein AidB-like acyl-CoA dehydrogenase